LFVGVALSGPRSLWPAGWV